MHHASKRSILTCALSITTAAAGCGFLPSAAIAQNALTPGIGALRAAQNEHSIAAMPVDARRAAVLPLLLERIRSTQRGEVDDLALSPADARMLGDFPRRESEFEERLTAEADARLQRLCDLRGQLDAVTLASEMTSIRAYQAAQRGQFYSGLLGSLSRAGQRSIDQWVQSASASGKVIISDWVAIATADPDFYRGRIESVCASLAQELANPPPETPTRIELVMPDHSR